MSIKLLSTIIHNLKIGMVLNIMPILLTIAVSLASCSEKKTTESAGRLSEGILPDTLRVATLYSPTSYFVFRDEPMGYDYSLVNRLGSDKGMAIDLTVAYSLASMIEMLDSGKIDLIAFEVPVTADIS